ncbi:hypothetical protein [Herpetosiphon llansteffanensis]|uniref:hypothetical protein n=1 Tax=Herpetosiphon llansteffanensis TaxID=2094568 RepID=UPI000D7BD487|nr:hypothetical protein [Herpetosiphon llansteffanensis]
MKRCEHRTNYDLREEALDPQLTDHLDTCESCATRARRAEAFDTVVRSAMITSVPDDLTAKLLALVPGLMPPLMVRSKHWKLQRRAFVGLSGVASILAIGLLVYGLFLLAGAVGVEQWLASASTWPGVAIDWLYRHIPSSRSVVAAMITMRQPLQWIILLILIWQVWERMPLPNKQQTA